MGQQVWGNVERINILPRRHGPVTTNLVPNIDHFDQPFALQGHLVIEGSLNFHAGLRKYKICNQLTSTRGGQDALYFRHLHADITKGITDDLDGGIVKVGVHGQGENLMAELF